MSRPDFNVKILLILCMVITILAAGAVPAQGRSTKVPADDLTVDFQQANPGVDQPLDSLCRNCKGRIPASPGGALTLPSDPGSGPHASNNSTQQENKVHIAFEVTQSWSGGFEGVIAVTNNAGWTIHDWLLEFDFDPTIDVIWDADILSQEGIRYAVSAVQESWAESDIGPGETVSFGFVASSQESGTLPFGGLMNGVPCVFNGSAPAPPPFEPLDPPAWPEQVFAPYVDATAWPPFDIVGTAESRDVLFYNLGFVIAEGAGTCEPSWGGYYSLEDEHMRAEVSELRELGGDVMVSFGGAAGVELAYACEDVDSLAEAYQSVIDAYGLSHVDLDVEGAWIADAASIERRSQAIAALQADAADQGRELEVWFTLPVLPAGLTPEATDVVASALAHGVEIAGVNVMAMDYGEGAAPEPEGRMGAYAIEAATSLFEQLEALYDGAGIEKSAAELWRMVGVTPMIGMNDVTTEVFYPEDAHEVLDFAREMGLGMLSFWSANRDASCAGGAVGYVSPTCSSVEQEPFEFSSIFSEYGVED